MKATLYRMMGDDHKCPFGIRAYQALKNLGYEVEDHHLKSREEIDAFKNEYEVKTTPQIFIEQERIGGFDALVEKFNLTTFKQEGTAYWPVLSVFLVTLLVSLAHSWSQFQDLPIAFVFKQFIALSMIVLALLKIRDLYAFTNQFITYDIIARKWLTYALIYPFAELFSGLSMVSTIWTPFFSLVMIFIGVVGGYSVIKAVYVDKRELKCACVGGNSNVPLGFISLTENLMMVAMGAWMLSKI